MNSKELGIYTSLRNTPETSRITDEGTKFYILLRGELVCFEGEGLDKMPSQELYNFVVRNINEYLDNMH